MSIVRSGRTRGASDRWRCRVAGTGALAFAMLLGVAGCSGPAGGGGQAPEESTGPAASAEPSSAPKSLPKGVKPAPIPTKVANDPTDRKNVVMTGCAAAEDGWQASGTATNPGKKSVDYQITVFFTTTSATTIDSAETEVSVKAGETVKWSAKQKFAAPKDMLCVLRGVAAT